MKIRSFIVAVAVLSVTTGALATGAIADDARIAIGNTYSSQQLQSICDRDGGWSYRAARGTYGCTLGGNVVECTNAGRCVGSTQAPFALVGAGASNHREIGAEAVLQMPAPPVAEELTSGAGGALQIAPQ